MAASERHMDVANKVLELLKAQATAGNLPPFDASDIKLTEADGTRRPTKGIMVSLGEESEGRGLNASDDIRYVVIVTRNLPRADTTQGMIGKSKFRVVMRTLFNRKRIGVDPASDIITISRPARIRIPKLWEQEGIDSNSYAVITTIRELRNP